MSAALTRHLLLQRFPRLQNARASIPFTSSIVVFAPPLLLRVARKARSCQDVSAAKSLFNLRVEFWLRGGRECVVCTGAAALAICSRPRGVQSDGSEKAPEGRMPAETTLSTRGESARVELALPVGKGEASRPPD
jgi:hypothetical protein